MSGRKDLGPTYTQDNVPEEIKNRFKRPDGTFAPTQQVPQTGFPIQSAPSGYPFQPTGFPVSSPYRQPGGYYLPQGVQVPQIPTRTLLPQSPSNLVFYPSSPSQIRSTPTKPREQEPVSPNRQSNAPQQEEAPKPKSESNIPAPATQAPPATENPNATIRPPFVPTYINPQQSGIISPGTSQIFNPYTYPAPQYVQQPQFAPQRIQQQQPQFAPSTTYSRPPVQQTYAPSPYGVSPQYNFRPSFPTTSYAYPPFGATNTNGARPFGAPQFNGLPQQGTVNRNAPAPTSQQAPATTGNTTGAQQQE